MRRMRSNPSSRKGAESTGHSTPKADVQFQCIMHFLFPYTHEVPLAMAMLTMEAWRGGMEMGKEIFFVWAFLLGVSASSCTPISTDYRVQGFKFTQLAFDSFEETPDLNRTVELERVRVHIVGNRKFFELDKAAAEGSSTIAYATSSNDIFLFGKRVGNKIIVNQAVLGHELTHLLNNKDAEIANPDELKELEYRNFNDFLPPRLHEYFMRQKD